MRRHLQYLKSVCRHKWFVFWACLQMGIPILSAIFHDWDKFLPKHPIKWYNRHIPLNWERQNATHMDYIGG